MFDKFIEDIMFPSIIITYGVFASAWVIAKVIVYFFPNF